MTAALEVGEWSAVLSGRTLPPGKPWYPFDRTPGPVWMGGKSRPHRDSIPDRPARSQSLYRLSYPTHTSKILRDTNELFFNLRTQRGVWLNRDWSYACDSVVRGSVRRWNFHTRTLRESGYGSLRRYLLENIHSSFLRIHSVTWSCRSHSSFKCWSSQNSILSCWAKFVHFLTSLFYSARCYSSWTFISLYNNSKPSIRFR